MYKYAREELPQLWPWLVLLTALMAIAIAYCAWKQRVARKRADHAAEDLWRLRKFAPVAVIVGTWVSWAAAIWVGNNPPA